METNFLSRYENKICEWQEKIENDPSNKNFYETEMNNYIAMCIPHIQKYTSDGCDEEKTISNPFNTKSSKGVKRNEIFKEYLLDVEDYKGSEQIVKFNRNVDNSKCERCGKDDLVYDDHTSDNICIHCGNTQVVLTGELTYKDEHESTEKIITYSYKRENHFNEWILQFQARETTNIPDEIITQLRAEFKKQKIKNLNEITHAKVRGLLKKLKLNKYYEHVPYIANMLNGLKPPNMSQELEDRLRHMFKLIQKPFDDHCPGDRKNFLSYSYVLYKFCELLSEDEFLPCFPLLKSKEKLYQQDQIWKKICKTLEWEFIASV